MSGYDDPWSGNPETDRAWAQDVTARARALDAVGTRPLSPEIRARLDLWHAARGGAA